VSEVVANHWGNAIAGVAILVLGIFLAGFISRLIRAGLHKVPRFDDTLEAFFSSMIRYFIITVTILMALSKFGVQTASLIAVFGAASLAIGLALQDTLKSLAAGVMLLIFRPFKIGDYVEAAWQAGTIKEVTLFTTEMATSDNVKIVVANADIWGKPVLNYSANRTRRVDLIIGIAHDNDVDKAFKAVQQVVKKDERALKTPEASYLVTDMTEKEITLAIRVWCKRTDYGAFKSDLMQAIHAAFEKKGITRPVGRKAEAA